MLDKELEILIGKKFKTDIVGYFENCPTKIFTSSQLKNLLKEGEDLWWIGRFMKVNDFIEFLVGNTKLGKVSFFFPNRNTIKYTWGDVSKYELVLSLNPKGYFSHYTAVFLHELTEQVPKTIYLNCEQSWKPRQQTELEQKNIDWAFKRPVRVSNTIADYEGYRVCLLSGKSTKQLGVVEMEGPKGETIPVTGIERTLIDITVRPVYSGGIFEVLKAYRLAKESVSINKLAAILKKLDYVYPYHQAIGFYMERAGVYRESQINLLSKFEMKHDFYLTYQMKDMEYSKRWRLYYPKGF